MTGSWKFRTLPPSRYPALSSTTEVISKTLDTLFSEYWITFWIAALEEAISLECLGCTWL